MDNATTSQLTDCLPIAHLLDRTQLFQLATREIRCRRGPRGCSAGSQDCAASSTRHWCTPPGASCARLHAAAPCWYNCDLHDYGVQQ